MKLVDKSKLQKIKCVFLDIDGTLLDIPDKVFEENYLRLLIPHFQDVLSPDKFLEVLGNSSNAMMKHKNYDLPVVDSFLSKFMELANLSEGEIWKRFLNFYETDFVKIKKYVNITNLPKRLIDNLKKNGFEIVIATNPIFPEIVAKLRLEWLGIDYEREFDLIPNITNFNALKPDPKYYEILMTRLTHSPEEILMVGNDYLLDGAASKLGIKTWIIDKNQTNVVYRNIMKIDFEGSLELLLDTLGEIE